MPYIALKYKYSIKKSDHIKSIYLTIECKVNNETCILIADGDYESMQVKFTSDAIDETDALEEVLRPRTEELGGKFTKVVLNGTHLTPIALVSNSSHPLSKWNIVISDSKLEVRRKSFKTSKWRISFSSSDHIGSRNCVNS